MEFPKYLCRQEGHRQSPSFKKAHKYFLTQATGSEHHGDKISNDFLVCKGI